jgi:hypothetical protein
MSPRIPCLVASLFAFAPVTALAQQPKQPKQPPPAIMPTIEVKEIESRFKLPATSEERWIAKRNEEYELHRKTLRLPYEQIGNRNPAWDEPARETLDRLAQFLAHTVKPMMSHQDVYESAKKAIDAGCNDPLILYAYALTSVGKNHPANRDETFERTMTAADAMGESAYPALRRCEALTAAARLFGRSDAFTGHKTGSRYAEQALATFVTALKEERKLTTLLRLRDQAGEVLNALSIGKQLDMKAAFDLLDAELVKIPEERVFRLQVRAMFMNSYAARARGNDPAKITPEMARTYGDRLIDGRKALLEAYRLDPSDPWNSSMMIVLVRGLGKDVRDFDKEVTLWFDRTMAVDPDNTFACQEMLDYLDPKQHGSLAEMFAFARACGKLANVRNGLGLLIADAHTRAVLKYPMPSMKLYLEQKSVRKEIDDAFAKYFAAEPKDPFAKNRYAMQLYIIGEQDEAWKMFEEGDGIMRGTSLFSADLMHKVREALAGPRMAAKINEELRKRADKKRHFETLAPPPQADGKTSDRLAAEWFLDQRGQVTVVVGKRPVTVRDSDDLPENAFEVETLTLSRRKEAVEMPELGRLKKLESLSLNWVDLRLSEAKRFGELAKLKSLSLTHAPEVDDAVAGEAVRHCPALSTLTLRESAVTDALLPALASLKQLSHLDLSGTKVTDKGVDALAQIPALKTVILLQTGITADGSARLRAARPQLQIVVDGNVRKSK